MKKELTAKRLRHALAMANMKPQELADKSGVNKASISQYVNGSHSPSNISSGKMGEVLNVNPLWLMGFDVPMEREQTSHSNENISSTYSDPDIRRIERARSNMDQKDREKMMNILKASFEDYFGDDYIDEDND